MEQLHSLDSLGRFCLVGLTGNRGCQEAARRRPRPFFWEGEETKNQEIQFPLPLIVASAIVADRMTPFYGPKHEDPTLADED